MTDQNYETQMPDVTNWNWKQFAAWVLWLAFKHKLAVALMFAGLFAYGISEVGPVLRQSAQAQFANAESQKALAAAIEKAVGEDPKNRRTLEQLAEAIVRLSENGTDCDLPDERVGFYFGP